MFSFSSLISARLERCACSGSRDDGAGEWFFCLVVVLCCDQICVIGCSIGSSSRMRQYAGGVGSAVIWNCDFSCLVRNGYDDEGELSEIMGSVWCV